MTAPTKDQLDRYMDLVMEGEDAEDAIAVVWADEPEPAPEPAPEPKPAKPVKPTVMVTEFSDGVIIGWSHCTVLNGGCGKHVSKCECKGGPRELRVFDRWRNGESAMPNYAANAAAAGITTATTTTSVVESVSADDEVELPATSTLGQVPCREGKHFVSADAADKNDDGTYTCHACQEAGITLDRSGE